MLVVLQQIFVFAFLIFLIFFIFSCNLISIFLSNILNCFHFIIIAVFRLLYFFLFFVALEMYTKYHDKHLLQEEKIQKKFHTDGDNNWKFITFHKYLIIQKNYLLLQCQRMTLKFKTNI